MPFVLDASVAATWVIPDEHSADTDQLMIRLREAPALIPSLFWFETRNIFLMAERRGRLEAGAAIVAMAQLRRLPMDDVGSGSGAFIIALADRHALSGYDASYLATSLQYNLPLATLDKKLAAAARKERVAIEGPLGGT